jgi:hypothetical protein
MGVGAFVITLKQGRKELKNGTQTLSTGETYNKGCG